MLSACRAGKVAAGPGAAAPAKTGLGWAPEAAAASPFKAADDAREAVSLEWIQAIRMTGLHHPLTLITFPSFLHTQRKRLVLQRYADMLHQAATASVVEAGVQTEEEATATAAAAAPTEQTAVVQAMLLKLAQLAYTKLGGLKKGFAHADGDGDHLISRADLALCLEHHLGLVLPSAEFDCLFSALDFDGTGSVHYYEWIRVLSHFADVTQAGAMPHNWSPAAATAALLAPVPASASTPAAVPVAAGTMEAVVEGDETAGLGVMDTVRQDDDKVLCQAAEAVRERGLHAHELIAQLLPDSGGKADAGGLQVLFAKLGVTGVDDARAQRLLARADLMGSGAIVSWELVRLLASATPKGE